MKRSTRLFLTAAGMIGLVLVMLALTGAFRTGVIAPEGKGGARATPPPQRTTAVERQSIMEYRLAAGTVRAREQAAVAAQISARVIRVLVRPGDRVAAGDLLVELDRRDLAARLDQARAAALRSDAERQRSDAAAAAAQAALREAQAQYQRIQSYFAQQAATRQQLEQTESRYRQAEAGFRQAQQAAAAAEAGRQQAHQALAEAEVAHGYGLIHAPQGGQVVQRLVDPGDPAAPGKPLIILHQADALRFEAEVPESLIGRIPLGAPLGIRIDALGLDLEGRIEERTPAADPASRTFQIKLALPVTPGLYPGMFGRLRIPIGERSAILVPAAAIRRVGQLELVTAEVEGRWLRILVKTGAGHGDRVEVLAGLSGSERVALE